jgi:hypothetical protein
MSRPVAVVKEIEKAAGRSSDRAACAGFILSQSGERPERIRANKVRREAEEDWGR